MTGAPDHMLDMPDLEERLAELERGGEVGFFTAGEGPGSDPSFTVRAVLGGYKVRRAAKHIGSFASLPAAMRAGDAAACAANAKSVS